MQKQDFETYQKRFRDFENLPKFPETHVFRGTIRHPSHQIPFYTSRRLKHVLWKGWVKLVTFFYSIFNFTTQSVN